MVRKDQVSAVGKWALKAFECLSTHDHDVTGRKFLEPFEVFGQMPGNPVPVTNDAVERHGGDGLEMLHPAEAERIVGAAQGWARTCPNFQGFAPLRPSSRDLGCTAARCGSVCCPIIEFHWE